MKKNYPNKKYLNDVYGILIIILITMLKLKVTLTWKKASTGVHHNIAAGQGQILIHILYHIIYTWSFIFDIHKHIHDN